MFNELLFELTQNQEWQPEANVIETDHQYRIEVDLPGVPKDAVTIAADARVLSITGERALPEEKRLRAESRFGKFRRRFQLPEGVRDQEIEASHRDGLLTIVVPKARAPGTRAIQISG